MRTGGLKNYCNGPDMRFSHWVHQPCYIFFLPLSDYANEADLHTPVDKSGTVVGENPDPYAILALWAVNGLSIVCWDENKSTWNSNPLARL